jgi:hypothetical protein
METGYSYQQQIKRSKLGSIKKRVLSSKAGVVFVSLVVVVALGLLVTKIFRAKSTSEVASANATAFVKKSQEVHKELTFPIRDTNDKELSRIKFSIEKVETASEIIVKGQKATAVPGRMFLLVNLKIVSDFNKSVAINTRDYVRLSVNGKDDELLAPDIHNDPVEVQAISTKYTRVGFPVNTSDSRFVLQIGEIKADKEKIELDLK